MLWFSEWARDKEPAANRAFLIANDTHSREESSASKQITYEFLIANAFQSSPLIFGDAESSWSSPPSAAPKLLDFPSSHTKHTTSYFLIDNFCTFSWPGSHPASSLEPPASKTSNRHIPELESSLSYRKQSTENFLIAKFRPILDLLTAPFSPCPTIHPPQKPGFAVDFSISGVIHAPIPARP